MPISAETRSSMPMFRPEASAVPTQMGRTDAIKQWVLLPCTSQLDAKLSAQRRAKCLTAAAAQRSGSSKKGQSQYLVEALKAGITGTVVIEATEYSGGTGRPDGLDIVGTAPTASNNGYTNINGEKRRCNLPLLWFNLIRK